MPRNISKIAMFLLAVYPVLWIYKSPIILSYGDLFLVLLSFYVIFTNKGLKTPKFFFLLWGYIALDLILMSQNYFKITYLLPGGLSYFTFAIVVWALPGCFDLGLFRKYYRLVFCIAFFVFCSQEIQYFISGYRFSALIPFAETTDVITMKDLIQEQHYEGRSPSLFREPSHFAEYLIPLLLIELFGSKRKDGFMPGISWLIVLALIITRSGTAFLGLAVALFVKMYYYYKSSSKHRYILFAIPLMAVIGYYVLGTSLGQSMTNRTAEFSIVGGSSGYLRVVKGFVVYNFLPKINKISGINPDVLIDIEANLGGDFFFTGEKSADLFFNGITSILIFTGVIGLFLYCLFYIAVYKKADPLGRSAILMLFFISFVSQCYLQPIMVFLTLLAIASNKDKYIFNRSSG